MELNKIKSFDELEVTTMTLVAKHHGLVNLSVAFHMFVMTKISIPQRMDVRKQLPWINVPGSFLSLRNLECGTRGIIRNNKKKFKNTITSDVTTSTTGKNISVKISPKSFHICGAKSHANCIEVSNIIIAKLNKYQGYLEKIHNLHSTGNYQEICDWIEKVTAGYPVTERIEEIVGDVFIVEKPKNNEESESEDEEQESVRIDKRISIFDDVEGITINKEIPKIPSHFDEELVKYLLELANTDYIRQAPYINKIRNMYRFNHVVKDPINPIGLEDIDDAMINYNFSLGFSVNRRRFNDHMKSFSGVSSLYLNEVSRCVNVRIPYETSDHLDDSEKSNSRHLFMTYSTGSVTLSSKNTPLMRKAYDKFMSAVLSGKESIKL